MLFRTANFEQRYDPTGMRDQVEPEAACATTGSGFWSQQWLGLKRLVGRADSAASCASAMLRRMRLLLDSFWRAVAYCLHPRVIALSLLPLVLMVALALGAGLLLSGTPRVDVDARPARRLADLLASFWAWLQGIGHGRRCKTVRRAAAGDLRCHAADRRAVAAARGRAHDAGAGAAGGRAALSRAGAQEGRLASWQRRSGRWAHAAGAAGAGGVDAAVADPAAGAGPAAADLGLADLPRDEPSMRWPSMPAPTSGASCSAAHRPAAAGHRRAHAATWARRPASSGPRALLFAAAFFVLVPLAIWIYTLVFAFSSLWFAHYCLAALEQLRAERGRRAAAPPSGRRPARIARR